MVLGAAGADGAAVKFDVLCTSKTSLKFDIYSEREIVVAAAAANQTCGAHGGAGNCLDINGGSGPDLDMYRCHSTDEGDYTHQQFVVDGATIRSARDRTACLGVSRPNPPWEGAADPWVPAGAWKTRVSDALRALKSAGLNGVVLLDVGQRRGRLLRGHHGLLQEPLPGHPRVAARRRGILVAFARRTSRHAYRR